MADSLAQIRKSRMLDTRKMHNQLIKKSLASGYNKGHYLEGRSSADTHMHACIHSHVYCFGGTSRKRLDESKRKKS